MGFFVVAIAVLSILQLSLSCVTGIQQILQFDEDISQIFDSVIHKNGT
jgi:hypothetical protein